MCIHMTNSELQRTISMTCLTGVILSLCGCLGIKVWGLGRFIYSVPSQDTLQSSINCADWKLIFNLNSIMLNDTQPQGVETQMQQLHLRDDGFQARLRRNLPEQSRPLERIRQRPQDHYTAASLCTVSISVARISDLTLIYSVKHIRVEMSSILLYLVSLNLNPCCSFSSGCRWPVFHHLNASVSSMCFGLVLVDFMVLDSSLVVFRRHQDSLYDAICMNCGLISHCWHLYLSYYRKMSVLFQ